MGFEHSCKVDIETARSAETALTEFAAWLGPVDKVCGIAESSIYERLEEKGQPYR